MEPKYSVRLSKDAIERIVRISLQQEIYNYLIKSNIVGTPYSNHIMATLIGSFNFETAASLAVSFYLHNALTTWLNENIKDGWNFDDDNYGVVVFRNETDAVFFKLHWC